MEREPNTSGMAVEPLRASGRFPAIYRIVVSGRLDESWSGRLGEMVFAVLESPGGAQTVLEGPIRDRAELNGILTSLFGLQLTLLRVEAVEEEQ